MDYSAADDLDYSMLEGSFSEDILRAMAQPDFCFDFDSSSFDSSSIPAIEGGSGDLFLDNPFNTAPLSTLPAEESILVSTSMTVLPSPSMLSQSISMPPRLNAHTSTDENKQNSEELVDAGRVAAAGANETQAATHAERNPHIPIQKSRTNPKLSNAMKESRELKLKLEKEKKAAMTKELDALMIQQELDMNALAARHGYKPKYIHDLVSTSKHFKRQRAVGLYNAKLHDKAEEVNRDAGPHDIVKIAEIRRLVDEDEKYKNLTKEEEDELKAKLLAHRELQRRGARASNKGAAIDMLAFNDRIHQEIMDLYSRTGAAVIVMTTRGNVNDTVAPNWASTPNADSFMDNIFARDKWDVMRLFEQWACSKGSKNKDNGGDSLLEMQKECCATVTAGLKAMARTRKIAMNYENYDSAIVSKHQVKLVGWTFKDFVCPTKICRVADVFELVQALRSGSCHWIRMTKGQVTKHERDLQTRVESGEQIGTKRKRRSDAGVLKGPRKAKKPAATGNAGEETRGEETQGEETRGKKRKTAGKENIQPEKAQKPRKRARKAAATSSQLPPMQHRSRSVISDSDGSVSDTEEH